METAKVISNESGVSTQVVFLKKKQFKSFIKMLHSIDENVSLEEKNGICLTFDTQSVVFVSTRKGLSENERAIVIAHEFAHASGISDEEEADIEAMTYLNFEQRDLLKLNWKSRHGHEFGGFPGLE